MYSRSISFFSWFLSQWPVADWGQPIKVWCQCQHTVDSRVNARLSELLHLPNLCRQRSLSPSKSRTYSTKNARISTASVISSGKMFYTRNTLDCDQSNVYSSRSRVIFSSISPNLPFRTFSLNVRSASDPLLRNKCPIWVSYHMRQQSYYRVRGQSMVCLHT